MMIGLILLFVGLSLDCFNVMMEKGAKVKSLGFKQIFGYSSLFALMNLLFLYGGAYLTRLMKTNFDKELMFIVGCMLFLVEGVFFVIKAFSKNNFEEKLDLSFNYKTCLILSVITNLDSLFAGICLAMLEVPVSYFPFICSVFAFMAAILGLNIGYHYGAKFQKVFSMAQGVIIIVFVGSMLVGSNIW